MSKYIASVGWKPLKPVLFGAIVAAFVLIGIETWTRVGAPGPTSAVAGSTIDPSAMTASANNLAISKPDDYSLVFRREDDSSSDRKSPSPVVRSGHSGPKSSLK